MNNKFFLYARKSTDVEDKQVLSIEAQITELRAFAKQNELNVIDTFIEKQSAKIPGRPIFNDMLARMEKDEADGILAWHPDRLALNSVDGGRIIYLVDCGRIAALKFPQFWFEPTPQGKFMLNIAFGQSKVSWWTERKQKLLKRCLSITPPATLGWKIYRTFWRNAGLCPAAEKESTRRGRLLSFPIPFTLGYFATEAKSTRASTSQSSQRNFLIRRKKS